MVALNQLKMTFNNQNIHKCRQPTQFTIQLYQICIQVLQILKSTLTISKYAFINLQYSILQTSKHQPMPQMCINAPPTRSTQRLFQTSQDPLLSQLAIKPLLSNLREWAHNLLNYYRTIYKIAHENIHIQRHMNKV